MFSVCPPRIGNTAAFLLPAQRHLTPIATSAAAVITLASLPLSGSDVIPEVGADTTCRQSSDADLHPEGVGGREMNILVSELTDEAARGDKDGDGDYDDVTAASPEVVASPSKDLKFGIDRILVKNNDSNDTSLIGTGRFCTYWNSFIRHKWSHPTRKP